MVKPIINIKNIRKITNVRNQIHHLRLKLFQISLVSLGLIVLNGCAVHKASFDCPNSKGMGCGSMIKVHEAIKDNSFPRESDEITNKKMITATVNQPITKTTTQTTEQTAQVVESSSENNVVYRSQDKIMRIWFNSYFDEHNNFHDSQYIYTIIEPAGWLVSK
jgi:type IV conjugative transfer system lipoprotein TraV